MSEEWTFQTLGAEVYRLKERIEELEAVPPRKVCSHNYVQTIKRTTMLLGKTHYFCTKCFDEKFRDF